MAMEVILVYATHIVQGKDMCLMLIPVATFTFLLGKQIVLKDRPIYLWLRKMSMFIFFIHAWFLFWLEYIKAHIFDMSQMECYFLTLLLSCIAAGIVIKLSEKEKLSFLKILY